MPADVFARFDGALVTATSALSLPLEPAVRRRMFDHYLLVVEANRRFNLTRITEPGDAAVRHYADALTLLKLPGVDPAAPLNILDIGTGAGFPAVPLAMLCPAWRVTAIDGTGKKARFVAESAAALGLGNVTAWHVRAGEMGREGRGGFDLVLLRAVSRIALGLREAHALVAPGGRMVFYKSGQLDEQEEHDGKTTAGELGFKAMKPLKLTLPNGDEQVSRRLISYQARA